MTIPDDLDLPGDDHSEEEPSQGEPSQGEPSEGELSQGDGAARVPLSEAIGAVLDVIDKCASDLTAVRHRLRQQELPEELSVGESELPRPDEQARHIAARLETCAGALRNASGETGDQPDLPPRE